MAFSVKLVLVAILFFIHGVTYAKNNVEFHIQFSLSPEQNDPCRYVRTYITWHSSHPGGNPYERFNEKNRGFLVECAEKRNSSVRTIMGALPTSRDGDALIWGKNIRFHSPEVRDVFPDVAHHIPLLGRLSVSVGAELVGMFYSYDDSVGMNRAFRHAPPQLQYLALEKLSVARRGYIVSPLPNLLLGVNYVLPANLGSLVWEQRRLGINKANLYVLGYSRRF